MKTNLKNFGMATLWLLNGLLYLMYVIVCFGKTFQYLETDESKEKKISVRAYKAPKMSELRE